MSTPKITDIDETLIGTLLGAAASINETQDLSQIRTKANDTEIIKLLTDPEKVIIPFVLSNEKIEVFDDVDTYNYSFDCSSYMIKETYNSTPAINLKKIISIYSLKEKDLKSKKLEDYYNTLKSINEDLTNNIVSKLNKKMLGEQSEKEYKEYEVTSEEFRVAKKTEYAIVKSTKETTELIEKNKLIIDNIKIIFEVNTEIEKILRDIEVNKDNINNKIININYTISFDNARNLVKYTEQPQLIQLRKDLPLQLQAARTRLQAAQLTTTQQQQQELLRLQLLLTPTSQEQQLLQLLQQLQQLEIQQLSPIPTNLI
jgi:hypothetical protein